MIISKKSVTILLLALLALSGCDSTDKSGKTARTPPVPRVETITTSLQPISHKQTISGTLEAATIVRLHNEVDGKIILLPFYEGDAVTRGTTIIKLDDGLIEAELEKSKAQTEQASIDLQRLKKLVPNNLASEEDLSRARTELEIAQAEEKLQRTRLSKTDITAMFDGIITERNYEPGDVVPQHSHILTLIDPASLHVKMQLSENWLSIIDPNSTVEIKIDALGNTPYRGEITRIHPTIDPDTRKGIVEVAIRPLPADARAGQLVRITLNSAPVDRLVLPSYSVRHDSTGAYVYAVNDENKVVKTYVSKGLQFGNQIEITDGLELDTRVVTRGFTALRDGITVEIVPRTDTE